MLKNTNSNYGALSIAIHWLSALVIFSLFGVGYWMVDLNYYSEWYRLAPHYHKSVGVLLLFLTLFRIVWKQLNPKPLPLSQNVLENRLASLGHLSLYIILLVILFSGYLISTADGRGIDVFNFFTVPSLGELFSNQEDIAGDIHEISAYIIVGLSLIHIVAALKHHFISKDNTLKRMLTIKNRTK